MNSKPCHTLSTSTPTPPKVAPIYTRRKNRRYAILERKALGNLFSDDRYPHSRNDTGCFTGYRDRPTGSYPTGNRNLFHSHGYRLFRLVVECRNSPDRQPAKQAAVQGSIPLLVGLRFPGCTVPPRHATSQLYVFGGYNQALKFRGTSLLHTPYPKRPS